MYIKRENNLTNSEIVRKYQRQENILKVKFDLPPNEIVLHPIQNKIYIKRVGCPALL